MPKYAPQDGASPILSTHKGGTAIAPAGTAIVLTAPSGATSALITPAGGAAYYLVNGATASATSPGYVPQDTNGYVFPVDNLGSLAVFQAAGTVYVQWYQDK